MSIDDRFPLFHRDNPQVYSALKSNALRMVARGARRISAKALYEFTRTEHWLRTSGEPWKLNNSFTSRYARLLAAEPELRGLIELRSIKGRAPSGGSTGTPPDDDDGSFGLDF